MVSRKSLPCCVAHMPTHNPLHSAHFLCFLELKIKW